jgi:hypothetical protein
MGSRRDRIGTTMKPLEVTRGSVTVKVYEEADYYRLS